MCVLANGPPAIFSEFDVLVDRFSDCHQVKKSIKIYGEMIHRVSIMVSPDEERFNSLLATTLFSYRHALLGYDN